LSCSRCGSRPSRGDEESLFLREVVNLPGKPGGDLKAMEKMLKHRIALDLEQGYCKPGEVIDVLPASKAKRRRLCQDMQLVGAGISRHVNTTARCNQQVFSVYPEPNYSRHSGRMCSGCAICLMAAC
jgi:hypothetical protein